MRRLTYAEELEISGFAVVEQLVDQDEVKCLLEAVELRNRKYGPEKNQRPHAMRNLLRLTKVRELADSRCVRSIVDGVLGPGARVVRGLLFDKTPEANWKVAWHQDLSIAVRERRETPGYGPWSIKAGIQHVQPPAKVLENMLTIRLHLDDCGTDNGPLRVIPGSHAHGVLNPQQVERLREQPAHTCVVGAGGAFIMRPLILHASSSASVPRHRRVVHLEYAAIELSGGLQWAEDVSESET
jgi:ectoine hydroxylase-related dioxygenase (phytanoyl-CoA dioxygenase family)